jgi:hypothetical protein
VDDTYKWLLFFHVLSAFAVLAGAVTISVAITNLRRSVAGEDAPALVRLGRAGLRMSDVGATLALILGVILAVHLKEYGPFDGWLIIAYVLWVAAAALSGRMNKAYGEGDGAGVVATFYLHAGFVVVVLLLLLDMIFKPGA